MKRSRVTNNDLEEKTDRLITGIYRCWLLPWETRGCRLRIAARTQFIENNNNIIFFITKLRRRPKLSAFLSLSSISLILSSSLALCLSLYTSSSWRRHRRSPKATTTSSVGPRVYAAEDQFRHVGDPVRFIVIRFFFIYFFIIIFFFFLIISPPRPTRFIVSFTVTRYFSPVTTSPPRDYTYTTTATASHTHGYYYAYILQRRHGTGRRRS